MMASLNRNVSGRPKTPRTVWVLGAVSLFMDISSEMIHALLPVFLITTLGASVGLVGLIEGVGESTSSIVKVFSGYLSDRLLRRKPLILIGYALGALSKPFFAIATSAGIVLAARFADRVGKGVRGAPRDALVADVTPLEIRGRAYGLRQSLDTVGAFVGPLLAIGLMTLLADDMRGVFWFAVIPGAIAVVLVLVGVDERPQYTDGKAAVSRPPARIGDVRAFPRAFWAIVAVGVLFALARFSEGFLVLKAHAEGLPIALTPLVLVSMNIVYSLGAYPAGAWSDKASSATLLLWGLAVLIGADLTLAFGPGLPLVFCGIFLWGAHMALTEGLLAKLVAQYAPPELRGSAFGLFNLATGAATLLASTAAGLMWEQVGPAATFLLGASFALLTSVVVFAVTRTSHRNVDGR